MLLKCGFFLLRIEYDLPPFLLLNLFLEYAEVLFLKLLFDAYFKLLCSVLHCWFATNIFFFHDQGNLHL